MAPCTTGRSLWIRKGTPCMLEPCKYLVIIEVTRCTSLSILIKYPMFSPCSDYTTGLTDPDFE